MNDLRHSLVTEGNLYGPDVTDDGGRMAVQEGERPVRQRKLLALNKQESCPLLRGVHIVDC